MTLQCRSFAFLFPVLAVVSTLFWWWYIIGRPAGDPGPAHGDDGGPTKELEVVIAEYGEDISWSDGYQDVRTVYCKAEDPESCGPGSIFLSRVGGEAHAFLHHIVENYESLADWTVFTRAEEPREGHANSNDEGGNLLSGYRFEDYVHYPEQHQKRFSISAQKHGPEALFYFTSRYHLRGVGVSDRGIDSARNAGGHPKHGAPAAPRPSVCPSMKGGDRWLPYVQTEVHNFLAHQCEAANVSALGSQLWQDFVGLPVPPNQVTFYTDGGLFAASSSRIRARPKEEYARLLGAMSHDSSACLGFFVEFWWWYIIGRPAGDPCPANGDDGELWVPEPMMGALPCQEPGGPTKEDVEIVIAQHDEDVSWIDDCRHLATIYCAEERPEKCAFGATPLDMTGQHQARAYLHHIVNRYDDLANWTVFTPGGLPTEGFNGDIGGCLMTGSTFADYLNYPKMNGSDADTGSLFLMTSKVHLPELRSAYRTTWRSGWEKTPHDAGRLPPKCPGSTEGDQWEAWVDTNWVKTVSDTCSMLPDQVYSFGEAFWYEFVGLPMPPWRVIYYAQGSRFGASSARIRERPLEQYEKLLSAINRIPCLSILVEFFWWYLIGSPDGNPCPNLREDTNFNMIAPRPLPKSWARGQIAKNVPRGVVKKNVSQGGVQKNVSQGVVQKNVSQGGVQKNVSQGVVQKNVSQGGVQKNVSQGVVPKNVSQGGVQKNVSQGGVQKNVQGGVERVPREGVNNVARGGEL